LFNSRIKRDINNQLINVVYKQFANQVIKVPGMGDSISEGVVE
jgi:hypothetical protein